MPRSTLCLLIGLLTTPAAVASLAIDRAILVFEAGKSPRQDVMASNAGDTNLFLEVEVLEVVNPGTDQEQRNVVRDPESIGFVAAPRRLMVPPRSRRPVRLMNITGHGDVERVYRVNIKPVLPPAETEGMGVRIVVAYQVLVFVAPKRIDVRLDGRRDGNRLTLRNTGNVNLMLANGRQCTMINGSDCIDVPGRRLYPGNTAVIELPNANPVTFEVDANGQRQIRQF
jgi:P pilus assembly chaperone PapD